MKNDTIRPDWRRLIAKKPGIHAWPPGQYSFFAVADEVLEHIASHTNERTYSLETGLGASTIVFSWSQSNHICVAPSQEEIDRLKTFCHGEGVSTDRVHFVPNYSEVALPNLHMPPLDLVLIDGRHGFPAPMVDWYYTSRFLKVGGRLLVDDVHLWPVQMLTEYLSTSPSWRVDQIFGHTISYVRLREGDERAEWIDQANVQKKTQSLEGRVRRERQYHKARQLASSGRFDLLAGKVFRGLTSRFRG